MKFMKKTKERLEREIQNTQDHESLYRKIITTEMRNASDNFISESSFLYCEDLLEGRLSFKGMNPEIERLMEAEIKKEDTKGEMQKDVSDEILSKKFQSYKKRKMESPSNVTAVKKRKYKQ